MTENLPKGLVITTGKVSSDFEGLGGVDVEDVAQLWRVYSTNRCVLQNGLGPRLENLFWRIWSSKRIHSALSGSTLAMLFVHISEENPIRTTPTATPRKSRSLGETQRAYQDSSSWSPLPATSNRDSSNRDSNNEPPPNATTRTRLPPILKKPRATQGEPQKTARILISDQAGDSVLRTASSNPPTPGSTAQNRRGSASKQGRKKTAFVANTTATSRRRPVLVRRRSSQPSSGTGSAKDSPLTTPQLTSTPSQDYFPEFDTKVEEAKRSGAPAIISETSKEGDIWHRMPLLTYDPVSASRDQSPATEEVPPTSFTASSIYHHRSPRSSSPEQRRESAGRPPTPSLVDKDFRIRFAEKKQQGSYGASSLATSGLFPSGMTAESQQEGAPERTPGSADVSPSSRIHAVPAATPSISVSSSNHEQDHDETSNGHSILHSIAPSNRSYPIRAQASSVSPSHSHSVSPSQTRSQLSLMIEQSRLPSGSDNDTPHREEEHQGSNAGSMMRGPGQAA